MSNRDLNFIPPIYVPTQYVVAAHGIPPIGSIFFPFSEYFLGVLTFPIVLVTLGIISVLVYQIILCARACAHHYPQKCARCCQNRRCPCCFDCTGDGDESSNPVDRLRYHRLAQYAFFIFLTMAIIVSCLVFIGNDMLSQGLRKFTYSLTYVLQIFTSIQNDSLNIASSSYQLAREAEMIPCSQAFSNFEIKSEFVSYANISASFVLQIGRSSAILSKSVVNIQDVTLSIIDPKATIIFCYVSIIVAFAAMLAVAYFVRNKNLLTSVITVTNIIVTLLTVASAGLMLFAHIGADYCITPASSTATLLTGLSAPEVTIAAVEFYTTCGGSSPFQTSFDFALEYFTLLNNTLDSHFNEMEQYLLAAQDETICLYNIRQEATNIKSGLMNILSLFECPPIWAIWDYGVQQSLCSTSFAGIFGIWMCMVFTGVALFFALISASYFYELWMFNIGDSVKDLASESLDESIEIMSDEEWNSWQNMCVITNDCVCSETFVDGHYDLPVASDDHVDTENGHLENCQQDVQTLS